MHLKPTIANIIGTNNTDIYTGLSTGGILHFTINPFGDVNSDMNLDIFDVIGLVNYIISYTDYESVCAADLNHDQIISVEDIIIMVNNILL